jgi:cephalosporin-C deacetylase-like acetyl esterase
MAHPTGTAKLALLVIAPFLAHAAAPWNMNTLSQPPKVYEAQTQEPGVRALYFESVSWKGKPTRVFAYYGAPAGKKLPAMVLIHGGGGTAFAEWVRMWNKRGYAAIAMDTCGNLPDRAPDDKPWSPVKKHHEFGGPEGWGGFEQIDEPITDQWSYHAVAAAILAHSLLRSFPEVDPKRIGVTGISWGGYLTDIVSGVDPRFRFAAPVYGCGFLGEDSAWLKNFDTMGKEKARKWLSLWDPSEYLPNSKIPMLWVTGTNDFAYPFPSLQKSYRLPKGPRTLAIRVRMRHSHPDGALPEEIPAFADAILKKGEPLPRITKANGSTVEYKSKRPVVKAELSFTNDEGRWQDRKWESIPAQLNTKSHKATAQVPQGVKAWYINLFDDKGMVVSSEHQ